MKLLRAISAQNKNEDEGSGVTAFRTLDRLTGMTRSFFGQSRCSAQLIQYIPIWRYSES